MNSLLSRTEKVLILLVSVMLLAACGNRGEEHELIQEVESMSIQITSSVFTEGGNIPVQYTCDGEDKSPPLQWMGIPDNTQSVALISDDPDAPGRV